MDELLIEKIDSTIDNVDKNTAYITEITETVVSKYSVALDTVMKNIFNDVISSSTEVPIEVLEQYYMELANILYFMYEKVETLGVYDDISKSSAREAFNNAYMNSQSVFENKKPTVAESTAIAEKSSLYETTVNNMYNRSYRIFKSKIDAGYEMCRCLSKIISRRIQDSASVVPEPTTSGQLLLESNLG